ncbi:MAG: periplasmic heavy metal sensor [Chitinophagaceae bacterium]|nr:periplasmic heavy metal sensor [Chitinophagaceae bacterium]
MNKLRFLWATIILLLLLNLGTLAWLFYSHNKQEGRRPQGGAADFIVEQLQLDQQQQEQFFELRRQHRATIRQAQEEDKNLHETYFGLLKTDNPDKKLVDSVAVLMAAQRSHMETATFDHFAQLRKICRDGKQKKLFDETIDEIARQIAAPGRPLPPGGRPPHDGPPPGPRKDD